MGYRPHTTQAMTPNFVRFNLPSHWASYLINRDASGLSDAEKQEADSCLKWLAKCNCTGHNWWTYYPESIEGDEFFSKSNDWDKTGGMVCTYVFAYGHFA